VRTVYLAPRRNPTDRPSCLTRSARRRSASRHAQLHRSPGRTANRHQDPERARSAFRRNAPLNTGQSTKSKHFLPDEQVRYAALSRRLQFTERSAFAAAKTRPSSNVAFDPGADIRFRQPAILSVRFRSNPGSRCTIDLIKRFIGFKNTQCLPPERATGGREDCHWKKVRSTSNVAAASR
jgi:hypothetical protein